MENETDDIQIVYKGRGSLRPRYSEVKEEKVSQGFKDLMAEVDNIIGTNQEGSVESATLPANCDGGATNEYTLEELLNESGDSSLDLSEENVDEQTELERKNFESQVTKKAINYGHIRIS